ncbi:MAG: mercury methylation corrinoid protein HgcA [Candidatus Zixiibacteriota bacterium]
MADEFKKNDHLIGLSSLPGKKAQTDYSNLPYIIGTVSSPVGEIPIVKTKLEFADRLGSWKVRWSIGRSRYRVQPGLYAVGIPDDKSPVFVSANYKMSFDRLRAALHRTDGWILVIDTKGINVWCAAGKGTFGTDEIIRRINMVNLFEIVSHRKIIVPQLGAPGIAAHTVKQITGFKIKYGPVRAKDIPQYLDDNLTATEAMRTVRFNLWDRMVLIPNDIILSLRYLLYGILFIMVLSGLGHGFYSTEHLIHNGIVNGLILLFIYILGHTASPTLLPYIPGRSFSAKGGWIGLLIFLGLYYFERQSQILTFSDLEAIGWLGLSVSVSSFIAMNFTGASTYTSLSGVKKEMKIAVPIQVILAVVALGFWIAGKFI